MKRKVYISFWNSTFMFFRRYWWILGQYGMSVFKFKWTLIFFLHRSCTSLQIHQQCMGRETKVPYFPYLCQPLFLVLFNECLSQGVRKHTIFFLNWKHQNHHYFKQERFSNNENNEKQRVLVLFFNEMPSDDSRFICDLNSWVIIEGTTIGDKFHSLNCPGIGMSCFYLIFLFTLLNREIGVTRRKLKRYVHVYVRLCACVYDMHFCIVVQWRC